MLVKFLKNCIILLIAILLCFTNATVFAYASYGYDTTNKVKNNALTIGFFPFNSGECCTCIANLIIDTEFYEQYMTLNGNNYVWKRDQNNKIINADEIKSLTPLGTIIKSDSCYEVVSTKYNLIDHGIPDESNPLSWALMPVGLKYVLGWAYPKNRVVKTDNGDYFIARFYTTANPTYNRTGWDKVEPVTKQNFEYYENSQHPNYAKPYINKIKRAYIWDAYTTYLIGDIVNYSGVEYIAIYSSNNKTPSAHAWAWQVL